MPIQLPDSKDTLRTKIQQSLIDLSLLVDRGVALRQAASTPELASFARLITDLARETQQAVRILREAQRRGA